MIGETGIVQQIPADDVDHNPITPEFVMQLLDESGNDPEAAHFVRALADQAIKKPMILIKKYLDEDPRVDGGTIGEPVSQPNFVFIVRECLLQAIVEATDGSVIGVPRIYLVRSQRTTFEPTSWWLRTAPDLPLNDHTCRARATAWYLFWHAETSP